MMEFKTLKQNLLKAELSETELREIKEVLKAKDVEINRNKMRRLAIGDKVSFESKGERIYGAILSINRKTVTLMTKDGKWRVHPTYLTVEED